MKSLAILLTILSFQCVGQDFKWLEGKWKEDNGKSFEVWVAGKKGMIGTGYKLLPDGTRKPSEEMSLVIKDGNYFFVSDVEGPQPAIEFKITSLNQNSFVAENPIHDFPKRIQYARMDDNHLQAFISDGDVNILRFFFTKVND